MPGLVEFFEIARSRPFVLLTNNSTVSALDCRAKLARMGVQVPAAAILTVSEATGRHLAEKFPSGSRAQVLGSAALQTAVAAAGMTLVPTCGDVVVVGLDAALTYQRLAEAVWSVFAGAGFVATSFDSVLLTEQGIAPGSGAIVAAIRACVEAVPVCVGKPSPSMFQMAARQLGPARRGDPGGGGQPCLGHRWWQGGRRLGRRCCSRGSPPTAARTSSSPTWSWPDCASCRPSWADRGKLEGHMSKLRDPVRPPRLLRP